MTIKNILDEELDLKTTMMQIQQLQQLDKSNATIANQLKNNPELTKQFQPFQSLVQQQLKQKQLEAQQAQQQQQQQNSQNVNTQTNGQQASGVTNTVTAAGTAGVTANQ